MTKLTLEDFMGIAATPLPSDLFDHAKYQPLMEGMTFEGARDYCLHNLKTHPKEKLWFFLRPAKGDFVVVREMPEPEPQPL